MIFRWLRKRTRSLSVFFTIVFAGTFFNSNDVFALTSGPHQPEYMSFESPDANDMVNLLTGDFNLNIPVLEIPTDYGSYTLPLSYHAGISPEQEAAWTGLGWNINAGAITRSIANYPDDADGQIRKTTVHDDGGRGWFANVPVLGSFGWNTEKGHGGRIQLLGLTDIGVYGWQGDNSVIGISVSKKGKVSVDPVELGISALTIISWGLSSVGSSAAKSVGVAIQQGLTAYSLAMITKGLAENNYSGVYNKVSARSHVFILGGYYKYYLDASRDEQMYGTIYLGKTPSSPAVEPAWDDDFHPDLWNGSYGNGTSQNVETFDRSVFENGTYQVEASSDIHMTFEDDYFWISKRGPVSLSHDSYSVMGNGISGSIRPYRLEAGSVAYPKEMSEKHYKYNVVPFLDNYKVQFKYEGEVSNNYQYNSNNYNTSGAPSGQDTGIDFEVEPPDDGQEPEWIDYILEDATLYSQRVEPNRTALDNSVLSLAKNVAWYSNNEIRLGTATSAGFIDFLPSAERSAFRNARPGTGIGGYSITREDGLTFHYALPVYDWRDYSKVYKENEPSDYTTIENFSPYATQWLLTAITGPDYIDRGQIGILDDGDWGYWLKFEYGKFSNKFKWRMPYNFDAYTDDDLNIKSYAEGKKETYYLDAIKSRTHTALFIKSERLDGRGHYIPGVTNDNLGDAISAPSSSLRLDKIFLLTNANYSKLVTANGIASGVPAFTRNSNQNNTILQNEDNFNDVIDQYDLNVNTQYETFLNNNSQRTILFNYDYSLCGKTPNSFASATSPPDPVTHTSGLGKLTLKSISIRSHNFEKVFPDYEFQYTSYNPDYNKDKWDGWGMYNRNGANNLTSHTPSAFDDDAAAWSLTSITTPLGTQIQVEYERDDYAGISGTITSGNLKGGDVRVKKLKVTDGSETHSSRYIYTKNTQPGSTSSGVVSREPAFIDNTSVEFKDYYDYQVSPVLYSSVTVLSGKLATDADFHTKTVFEFESPIEDEVIVNNSDPRSAIFSESIEDHNVNYFKKLGSVEHVVNVHTNKIGRLNAINVYDNAGTLKANSEFIYSDTPSIGVFSEGVILAEALLQPESTVFAYMNMRTTKRYHPNILEKVINTNSDGLTSSTTFKAWDFISGQVTSSEYEGPNGLKFKNESVPAYHIYPEMGPKGKNSANKHMLIQLASSKEYKLSDTGSPIGLIGASVQTWNKTWPERGVYDDVYKSFPETRDNWKQSDTYLWRGNPLDMNTDGTFNLAAYEEFNFSNLTANTKWINAGGNTFYDHQYSIPLESKDINGKKTSMKMDLKGELTIAQSANASYTEFTSCGFESLPYTLGSNTFAEGEINISSSFVNIVSTPVHTGARSIAITGSGFSYHIEHPDFVRNRPYRLSAWVHKDAYEKATLFVSETTGASTVDSNLPAQVYQSGDWYLLSATYTPTGDALTVGVKKNASGGVLYVDDFRFQPVDATMTAYVYNEQKQLTHVFDNNNFFTRYEYDATGRVIRTYKQTLGNDPMTNVKLVSSQNYGFSRD